MKTSRLRDRNSRAGSITCGSNQTGKAASAAERKTEQGWALLGLILALTIMAIMMVGIMPNVQMEVRRDKEEEMMFRGEEMAVGIARYYNLGRPGTIGLAVPPPYGYLTDLKKLSEGVTLGTTEIKFVRGSAMTDPMVNREWVPVRARDPRLMPMLQAIAAANLTQIPPQYMALAAAPIKTHFLNDNNSGRNGAPGNGQIGTTPGTGSTGSVGAGQTGTGGGNAAIGQATPQNRPVPQRAGIQPGQKTEGDDDDDDDDDDTGDPLAHLLKNDQNNLPIVGVAPNLKGPSVRALYGMTRYEQWVFIFVPTVPTLQQPVQPPAQPGASPVNRVPRVSQ